VRRENGALHVDLSVRELALCVCHGLRHQAKRYYMPAFKATHATKDGTVRLTHCMSYTIGDVQEKNAPLKEEFMYQLFSKLPVQSPVKNEICTAKVIFAAPRADFTRMTVKYDILK